MHFSQRLMQYTLHILLLQWRSHTELFHTRFFYRKTKTSILNSSFILFRIRFCSLFCDCCVSSFGWKFQLKSLVKPRHWAHCILLAQVSSKLHKRDSNDAAGSRLLAKRVLVVSSCSVLIHNYCDGAVVRAILLFRVLWCEIGPYDSLTTSAILLLQLVELLLQSGADQHLKNSRGVASREIAGPQVLDLFLQYSSQQPPAENTPTEGECNTSFAFSP